MQVISFKVNFPDLRMKRSGVPSLVIASATNQSQHLFGAGSESGLSPSPAKQDKKRSTSSMNKLYEIATFKGGTIMRIILTSLVFFIFWVHFIK